LKQPITFLEFLKTGQKRKFLFSNTQVCYKLPLPQRKREMQMPIYVHENEHLKNASYLLSEHIFRRCKLTNCNLFYDGGVYEWVETTFENCIWGFRGPALATIQLCGLIGMLKPGQAPMPSVPQGSSKMN
jgi:hypothetical protein